MLWGTNLFIFVGAADHIIKSNQRSREDTLGNYWKNPEKRRLRRNHQHSGNLTKYLPEDGSHLCCSAGFQCAHHTYAHASATQEEHQSRL